MTCPRFFSVCSLVLSGVLNSPAQSSHEDMLPPPESEAVHTPDFVEATNAPPHFFGSASSPKFSVLASSAQQQQGVLSGKIVFMNSGHGWTYETNAVTPYWRLQRGVGNSMNEDYGNLDQLNFFAAYCFNAGATVVDAPPKFQLITMLPDNQYKLIISGVPGSYAVESATNLNGGWTSLTNLSNTNGTFEFTDTPSATVTQRYYRALIVP